MNKEKIRLVNKIRNSNSNSPIIIVERKIVNGKIINNVKAENCNIYINGQEIFIEGRPLNSYIEESIISNEPTLSCSENIYKSCHYDTSNDDIDLETSRHDCQEREKLLKNKNEIRYNEIRNKIRENRQKLNMHQKVSKHIKVILVLVKFFKILNYYYVDQDVISSLLIFIVNSFFLNLIIFFS